MERDGKVIQMQHFCHHLDTIFHPKSGHITTKLHGTSTCGCNNNAMYSGRDIFTFPTQGRRSGYESGGDGIHVNPERSFGGTNGEPPSEASQLWKGGPGVLPRKI